MSQYNPPPPGEPMPPLPGYPPGGLPAPTPQRANGPAIASLVLGILGCIPEITGILAIIFGIVGLRRARNPQVGGKGMAIAGLVLGLISVVLWSLSGTMLAVSYSHSAPARALTRQCITDLSNGNIRAASNATASNIKQPELVTLSGKMRSWGSLGGVHFTGFFYNFGTAGDRFTLSGIAEFSSGTHVFTVVVVDENGQLKVQTLQFQ